MTMTVWYSTRWNELTRRPIARHEWIDSGRAQKLYERHEFFDIVDAAVIKDELPFPRWVISPSHGFRVQFFDQELSVTRVIDYTPVASRLLPSLVVDYTYPDVRHRWMQSQAARRTEIRIKPDGSGAVRTKSDDPDEETLKEFAGLDIADLLIPVPEFGDWAALTVSSPTASELAERVVAS